MPSDRELLEEFTRSKSEEAFRTLVERHLDLVHSVARRVTLNDDLARDVSQAVFLKLATRPDDVPHGIKLLAWLHRTARHKAIDLVRSENRRRRRERTASQNQKIEMDLQEQELDWEEIEPFIDGALAKLSEPERTLILSRYYKRNSHASTAHELGISEDAARMRTKRALKKLQTNLKKRGIMTSAALLGTLVSTNAVAPAPQGLAAVISSSLPSAAGSTSSFSLLALAKSHLATLAIIAFSLPTIAIQLGTHEALNTKATEAKARIARSNPEFPSKTTSPSPARKPVRTLEQILATPDPQTRLTDLLKFANTVPNWRIPTAIADLQSLTPDWDQDGQITSQILYTRWAKSDITSALVHVENLDYGLAGDEISFVLAMLAAQDPIFAADWLESPANKLGSIPILTQQLAGTIAKEWARISPESALQWALSLGDSKRAGAMHGVLGTLISTSPDRVEESLQKWTAQNPAEATDWKRGRDS